MTQKYNSAQDIDPEFIPDLESLLSHCVPSFDLIKQYEKQADAETHFAYYLFFGDRHNAPIGFAQVELNSPTKEPKSLFKRLLSKNKNQTKLKWSIPGSLGEGFIFDPQYIQHACPEAKKIFMRYQKREDICEQELVFSSAYESMGEIDVQAEKTCLQEQISDTLIKNQASYEEYFQSLPQEIQKEIKDSWKALHRGGQILDEFAQLKEAFAYKSQGAKQYSEIKKSPLVDKYLNLNCKVDILTTSSKEQVANLVLFFEAKNGDCFYDILIGDEKHLICHQIAIMKFFESPHLNKLHYLGDKSSTSFLKELSFTTKELFKLYLKKFSP